MGEPAVKPEVSPDMVEAGVVRLPELLSAGVGSAYVAEEVYLAT
jgi:hypothetical protein